MDKLRQDYLMASLDATVSRNPHILMKAFQEACGCEKSQEYSRKLEDYVQKRILCN